MRKNSRNTTALAALLTTLCACTQAPVLDQPRVALADTYREQAPWMAARPADALPRNAWWTLYGDAGLDEMQAQLIKNSPDLEAALAHYRQASAFTDQLRAGLYPTVGASAVAERVRQRAIGSTPATEVNLRGFAAEADYEVDLWGRVSNTLAAGRASEQAAQAELESARQSLQTDLADKYIALRGLDQGIALFRATIEAYARALALTQTRHDGGLSSGLDVSRAQTQLETARSQLAQQIAQRALLEHAIAALTGASPSQFNLPPRLDPLRLPSIPAGLPSELLQRRPDIASAQRRMEAANAAIGVARAAYFPAVTLSAGGGYQSTAAGALIATPNLFWAIGPTLVAPLFDGGRRDAQIAQARAALDESGARYKSVVLGAFVQVEDNLALLNNFRNAVQAQGAALAAARKTLSIASSRYRDGAASYLDVVVAQTMALQVERDALDLDTRQRRASVQLIRALGGGWDAANATARAR